MSDVSWNTRVLNSFIAAVEDQEDAMLTAMRDQTLLEPAGRDRLAALERQVISEWTSARLALSTVIPDWSARIKTGIFAGSERSQQKKLAQEAVALIERREDHLAAKGRQAHPPSRKISCTPGCGLPRGRRGRRATTATRSATPSKPSQPSSRSGSISPDRAVPTPRHSPNPHPRPATLGCTCTPSKKATPGRTHSAAPRPLGRPASPTSQRLGCPRR
jgi:hypothetical protein